MNKGNNVEEGKHLEQSPQAAMLITLAFSICYADR